MREIRFRAWDKALDIMLEVSQMDFLPNAGIHLRPKEDIGWLEPKDYELMQYTGLKDSKGVDIYEGDIVQDDIKGKDVKGVVEYREEETAFVVAKEAATCRLMFWCIDGCTVIGNRFQHPDLLQDKGEE